MKILVAILLSFLIVKHGFSQTAYIESLREQLQSTAMQDTQRVLSLSTLAVVMGYVRPDSAMVYARDGVSLAKKINFEKGEMYCKKSMGEIMWIVGEYSQANELLLQVLKYAKSINDPRFQMEVFRT